MKNQINNYLAIQKLISYESTESEYSESDNTDDESSMNNNNVKSIFRVEKKKEKCPSKTERSLA